MLLRVSAFCAMFLLPACATWTSAGYTSSYLSEIDGQRSNSVTTQGMEYSRGMTVGPYTFGAFGNLEKYTGPTQWNFRNSLGVMAGLGPIMSEVGVLHRWKKHSDEVHAGWNFGAGIPVPIYKDKKDWWYAYIGTRYSADPEKVLTLADRDRRGEKITNSDRASVLSEISVVFSIKCSLFEGIPFDWTSSDASTAKRK
jgi:hypothetical protein